MQIEVRSSRWVNVRAPANLCADHHHIFPPGLSGELPPQRIAILPGAEVAGRGPIKHQGRYLGESFVLPSQLDTWKRRGGHIRQRLENLISPVRDIAEPAVWMTDNWSSGYYHWFCDALPRLELALQRFDAGDLTLLLPYKFRRHRYIQDSLQAFGLRQVRLLKRFERLRCRELILPIHIAPTGSHDPDLLDSIRQRFQRVVDDQPMPQTDRIYISRAAAGRRRVVNDAEVSGLLSEYGFKTIVAEKMTWQEQVATISNAQFLVSNHGAGLTNMIALPKASNVLEIRERCNTTQGCYWGMASAMRINYHYSFADKANPAESIHTADVIADLDELRLAVSKMVGSQQASAA